MSASISVHDTIQWVHEPRVLYGHFVNYKQVFTDVAIKPMCLTRWICRSPTIAYILNQYSVVLPSLEELANHRPLSERHDIVKFKVAYIMLLHLGQLNMSLPSEPVNATLSGMIQGVEVENKELMEICCEESFQKSLRKQTQQLKILIWNR